MNKTAFRLKVAGVALLLASSIGTVVLVAQRPHKVASGTAAKAAAPTAQLTEK